MHKDKNATYLFQKSDEERQRKFYSSESWWTAFFTILALWKEKQNDSLELPWYGSNKAVEGGVGVGIVSFKGITYQNMAADARLNGQLFNVSDWPNDFLHLRPDVTFIKSESEREVIFIETKTIGATAQKNIRLYESLLNYLRSKDWKAEMYYLISKGHEDEADWMKLEKASACIIIWEDVFKVASSSCFEDIFPESLLHYV
jgi:hypothetical protein